MLVKSRPPRVKPGGSAVEQVRARLEQVTGQPDLQFRLLAAIALVTQEPEDVQQVIAFVQGNGGQVAPAEGLAAIVAALARTGKGHHASNLAQHICGQDAISWRARAMIRIARHSYAEIDRSAAQSCIRIISDPVVKESVVAEFDQAMRERQMHEEPFAPDLTELLALLRANKPEAAISFVDRLFQLAME